MKPTRVSEAGSSKMTPPSVAVPTAAMPVR
jgi:hypothetical protein